MVKQTRKNGKFVNCPGPGRPKGSKNRYTQILYDIFDIWEEEGCKERLREYIKEQPNFTRFLEVIVRLMPKRNSSEEAEVELEQYFRLTAAELNAIEAEVLGEKPDIESQQ